ncbi:MAG: uroporphyrinogen-III synthase [Magnetospiraceae bacterium]
MRVLLTRPVQDSTPLARQLADDGIDADIAPLLQIKMDTQAPLALEGVQAILITSANGARALAARGPVPDLPVYAVGDASARACREAGMVQVFSADGDVDDLARLVTAQLAPVAGALLHVAGSRVAGDLAGFLERQGFTYRRAVLYAAEIAESIPKYVRNRLLEGNYQGVLFFSPRTATTFATLAHKIGIGGALGGTTAYCLSPAVAAKLGGLGFADRAVAPRPHQEALRALVVAGLDKAT